MSYKQIRALKQIKGTQKLFNYACYWLDRYPCSVLKLKERLLKKCSSEEIIDEVINRLKELNYLNDKKLASNIISTYLKKGYGKNRINTKLYEKKIFDKEILKSAWEEFSPEDENEKIMEVVEKRVDRYDIKEAKGKKALIVYLFQRGFEYDCIMEALRKKKIL